MIRMASFYRRVITLLEQLLLDGGVADYEFLNKSRREIDGVDDKEEWINLKVKNITLNTYGH